MNSTKPSQIFLRQVQEIAEYIASKYPAASKIVELGVGFSPWVALTLHRLLPHARIIVVDKNPEALRGLGIPGLEPLLDDILAPKLDSYLAADLLYSIHPPPELLAHMEALASAAGSDLLIKPLSEDAYLHGFPPPWRMVNLRLTSIYLKSL